MKRSRRPAVALDRKGKLAVARDRAACLRCLVLFVTSVITLAKGLLDLR
jgi:hypothetical protein